jgi:hypothetical protein
LELLRHCLQTGFDYKPYAYAKRTRPLGIGKLSENCQHVGGVPITSGASGTVAFTDGAQEKLASPSNCKIPSGVQLPPAASLRRSHTRAEGHRHFRAIHQPSPWASSANHPNIRTLSRLFAAPTLECSDVRLGWQQTRKRVLELRRPVTVSRDIRSFGRMNGDRTDLEVFQFGLAQDTENFRAERIVPAPLPGNLRATAPTGIDDRP